MKSCRLTVLADAENEDYVVGPYPALKRRGKKNSSKMQRIHNDTKKAFRDTSWTCADGLDKHKDQVWVGKKQDRLIRYPMPNQMVLRRVFYPDFLWGLTTTVWAIDTTGKLSCWKKCGPSYCQCRHRLKHSRSLRRKVAPTYTLRRTTDGRC